MQLLTRPDQHDAVDDVHSAFALGNGYGIDHGDNRRWHVPAQFDELAIVSCHCLGFRQVREQLPHRVHAGVRLTLVVADVPHG